MVQTASAREKKKPKANGAGHAGRVNAIGGFYVGKVDEKVMRTFIKSVGAKVEIDGSSTTEQIAVALTLHFREVTKDPDDFAKCDECGGEAPDAYNAVMLENCPFCGIESDPVDAADAGDDDSSVDVVETAGASSSNEDDGDGEDGGADAGDSKDEPEVDAKPAASKKKAKAERPAKESTAMTTTAHVNGKANGKSTALATTPKAGKGALAKFTDRDLDKAVEEVIRLKTVGAQNYYELGQKILEINEKNLWKLRVDEDNKARYSGFDAFVHHELKMSSTNAFNMIAWARQYSEKDVAQMGRTNAALIMKAPPEDRKALTELAKAGASRRTIEKKVTEAKKKRNYEGGSARAKAGAKGAKARAEKIAKTKTVAQDKITIAKIEGLKKIKLYAKPASLKNLDFTQLKRAKALGDEPFGKLELANGVVMYVHIVKEKDGTLSAKFNTQRESPVGE